jgi:hypothetical protein
VTFFRFSLQEAVASGLVYETILGLFSSAYKMKRIKIDIHDIWWTCKMLLQLLMCWI